MAKSLTTNGGSVKVYTNGNFDRSLPKGSFSVSKFGDKLKLEHPSFHTSIMVDESTTLDGGSFGTLDELADALSTFSTGGGSQIITSDDITDATEVGKDVLTAEDATAARTAIGAGTSNLGIGTTGTTAAAGNHIHPDATGSDAGFMSASDKSKLNGIPANANNFTTQDIVSYLLGLPDAAPGNILSVDSSGDGFEWITP